MAKKATEEATGGAVVTLTLNKAARELFGDAEFARIRVGGGEIYVLPSKRTKGIGNLPKTDAMVELDRTKTNTRISLPLDVEVGTQYVIESKNYNWKSFVQVPEGETPAKDAAVAKVTK